MTHTPRIHDSAFVHPKATVIGNVTLGPRVSVWPMSVLRGDVESIEIGEDTNIQDGTIVHTDQGLPTIVGKRVGIGHRAIIHGTMIEPDCLIAMGAILLSGCQVGTGSIIGAGALCTEGMKIPANSLVIGVPGRIVRQTTEEERDRIRTTVEHYLELSRRHQRGEF